MRRTFAALSEGVAAPWRRKGLVAVLWLARLLPIILVLALPAYEAARARSEHHPDASVLLDPASDASGFAFAWLSDFSRLEMDGAPDTLFWLIVACWVGVTFLSAGIVSRLLPRSSRWPAFLPQCGRFLGRFVRLALLFLVLAYALDAWIDAFLVKSHEKAVLAEHLEDVKVQRAIVRGTLLVSGLYLLGLIHAYARIDLVAHDRRSALLAFVRGVGTLLLRLPSLFVIESGLLLVTGGVLVLTWILTRRLFPLGTGAGWIALGLHLALLAALSYVRTGLEVGAMAARCRLIAPEAPPVPPAAKEDEDLSDRFPALPPQNP